MKNEAKDIQNHPDREDGLTASEEILPEVGETRPGCEGGKPAALSPDEPSDEADVRRRRCGKEVQPRKSPCPL